jgi:hypothetical protein
MAGINNFTRRGHITGYGMAAAVEKTIQDYIWPRPFFSIFSNFFKRLLMFFCFPFSLNFF